MRSLTLFAMVISMSTLTLPQTLPAPQAITDPKADHQQAQCECRTEPAELFIERLYMTRSVGATTWSARRQDHRIRLEHQRPQQYLAGPRRWRWPTQLTVSDQRQTQPTWSPDGKVEISYISDYDGDEQWDIFFVSPKDGTGNQHHNTREISAESSDLVAGRPLSRLYGEAQRRRRLRNCIFDTLMPTTKHLTTGTPKDQD